MKIAYCIPSIHHPSGIERVVLLKANHFADIFGYEVYIITTDGKDQEIYYPVSPKVKLIHLDINFYTIYRVPFIRRVWGYFLKQRIHKKRLKEVLFEIKPDIAISVLFREVKIITSIKDGSRKLGEFHFHKNAYPDPEMTHDLPIIKNLYHILMRRLLVYHVKLLDQFIVLTHQDRKQWSKLMDRITVISNPISFFPDQVSDCRSHKVIAVGRYCNQKGYDLLIKAWKLVSEKHPNWILQVYGGGEKEHFQPMVESLGLTQTCILESAVHNIDEKYRESSIHVLSSRDEGFGMVILEAMACGLPVVSFDCMCGPGEIIKNGEDGFLVEPENINELAEKIIYLIENEEIRIRMGQQARKNVERFKIEHVAQQWKDLFESIR